METEIDLKQEYLRLANSYSIQSSEDNAKENIRKDVELLLDVLGHHTITKTYNESSEANFVIDDEIDRRIITQKLLSKIEQL